MEFEKRVVLEFWSKMAFISEWFMDPLWSVIYHVNIIYNSDSDSLSCSVRVWLTPLYRILEDD